MKPILIGIALLSIAYVAYRKTKGRSLNPFSGSDNEPATSGGYVSPGTTYDPILGEIHPYDPNIPVHNG